MDRGAWPAIYSPCGCKRVGHNLGTKQHTHTHTHTHTCMYIYLTLGLLHKRHSRAQSRVKGSLFLSCVFLSLGVPSMHHPVCLSESLFSMLTNPLGFFETFFSRCFTITDESSNSCSCGPIEYSSYSHFFIFLHLPKALFSSIMSWFLMG